MKITVIGGGPGGLYTSILLKRDHPAAAVDVFERNKPDDTFGWGVVFSAETLSHFEEADPESYQLITDHFRYWDDIDTFTGDTCIRSTGHGFCGMSRKLMLNLLQQRCRELDIKLHFEHERTDTEAMMRESDLVVAADGINSVVRAQFEDIFKPTLDWRQCKFCWLGTDLEFEAFTFIYRENQDGYFRVHAYPFAPGLSTFIVECTEETWLKAGLDRATEEATVAYCEELFRNDLHGHRLLTNRSIWRTFPTIRCESWIHRNLVIIGDAAHTAHFSIGSGTKLAMEDAIGIRDAFRLTGADDVPAALRTYQENRHIDVLKLQKAAQVSLEWFEHTERYRHQHPIQFTFNELTRSKRITWDNLERRDPAFIARVREWYAKDQGAKQNSDGSWPVPMFTPFQLREMTLVNRVVVSPMCTYSAEDGCPGDWHLVHLGSRAIGGAGLVMTEMTDVSAEGRITKGCTGLYHDSHVVAWRRITDFIHRHSQAKVGLQLAHAGRKGSTRLLWLGMDQPLDEDNWEIISASPIPYLEGISQIPREMTRVDMDKVCQDFVASTRRAIEAGFDMLEVHMAHGYLLSCFISPLTNRRSDGYGGSNEARMRFPLEVFDAVREAWPQEKPLSVRISATDWVAEGGLTGDDAVEIAQMLKDHGVDIIDVSAGQTVKEAKPNYGRMFQVPFSDQIRHSVGIPTMSVGAIQGGDHCNTILAAGRADLTVMARPHLTNPYLTLHEAQRYGHFDQYYPPQYIAVQPRKPQAG